MYIKGIRDLKFIKLILNLKNIAFIVFMTNNINSKHYSKNYTSTFNGPLS